MRSCACARSKRRTAPARSGAIPIACGPGAPRRKWSARERRTLRFSAIAHRSAPRDSRCAFATAPLARGDRRGAGAARGRTPRGVPPLRWPPSARSTLRMPRGPAAECPPGARRRTSAAACAASASAARYVMIESIPWLWASPFCGVALSHMCRRTALPPGNVLICTRSHSWFASHNPREPGDPGATTSLSHTGVVICH